MDPRNLNFLIVEDEELEFVLTQRALTSIWKEPHQILRAKGIAEAKQVLSMSRADVILLDLNVTDSQGLKTVEAMTEGKPHPIVVLTSMKDKATALKALEKGAQDYIVKGEYTPSDLGRAIEFALARMGAKRPGAIEHEGTRIDFSRLKLISHAKGAPIEVDLTSTEMKVMSLLIANMGIPVSREDLAKHVLGEGLVTSDRTTDNQISRLRSKIEAAGLTIQSVRGVGYKLTHEKRSSQSKTS